MASSTCAGCGLIAYPLERVVLADKPFHKSCAKCEHCGTTISAANAAGANGRLFCKPHFLELFKSSGGSYAFVADASKPPPPSVTIGGSGSFKLPKGGPAAQLQVSGDSKLARFLAAKEAQASVPVEQQKAPVAAAAKASSSAVVLTKSMTPAERLAAFSSSNITKLEQAKNSPVVEEKVEEVKPAPVIEAPEIPREPTIEPPAAPAPVEAAAAPAKKSAMARFLEATTGRVTATSAEATPVQQQPLPPPPPVPTDVAPAAAPAPLARPPLPSKSSASVGIKPTPSASEMALQQRLHEMETTMSAKVRALEQEVQTLRSQRAQQADEAATTVQALEREVHALRDRLELANAGKEALAAEVVRLTQSNKEQIPPQANSTKSLEVVQAKRRDQAVQAAEQSMKTAKRLLTERRITQAQYQAAVRAAAEASQLYS